MRISVLFAVPLLVWVGCGSDDSSSDQPGGPGGTSDGGTLGDGGKLADGGKSGGDAGRPTVTTLNDGGTIVAGNPDGSCTAGIPAEGAPADVSHPTATIGTGTPASCTFASLNTAVQAGGIIVFNCGSDPVTIPIASTMNLVTTKDTVIDGGGKVTLDGQNAVEILNFNIGDYQSTDVRVTLQHIAFVNGKATPTTPVVAESPPCAQGWADGQGGAIHVNDGNLTVIDAVFANNTAADVGPDVGGGAIYIEGSRHGALIVGSTFSGNSGSNGGGVGALNSEVDIYNSLLTGNTATGHDANSYDGSCASTESGSGGNGGAMSSDGASTASQPDSVVLCGNKITNNKAGTAGFGSGVFFTSDNYMDATGTGSLTITDTTVTGNTSDPGKSWTIDKNNGSLDLGSAFGVNAVNITVTNSTLQP